MKRIAFLLLALCAPVIAQDIYAVGEPIGSKIVNVGFRNNAFLNVATINASDYIVLRWSSNQDKVKSFSVRLGVPKAIITTRDFGLLPLSEITPEMHRAMNFITPIEVGLVGTYLLRAMKFSYCVQIIAHKEDGQLTSQTVYIKQKFQK